MGDSPPSSPSTLTERRHCLRDAASGPWAHRAGASWVAARLVR